jgi:multidrug resistance efflux pump
MPYSVFVTSSLASSKIQRRKKMKRFLLAIALACALSGTALAGDIHSVGAPAPQASSPTVVAIILTIMSLVGR